MMTKESRIREKAYHLWQGEGFPEGREIHHWNKARELVELEERQGELPTLTDQGEGQAVPTRPVAPATASAPPPRLEPLAAAASSRAKLT